MARTYLARFASLMLVALLAPPVVGAQTPQPFPRPGTAQPQAPPPVAPPAPAAPTSVETPRPQAAVPPAPQPSSGVPTAATLGFPIYPAASYITSYDAGRGQRYYLFGTTAPYTELVTYYRTQLKDKGDEVFEEPPTHMFSIGRFREETMAFPAGVTIKDFTWGGSQGYPNPVAGAVPVRFPTIIMIVPAPQAVAPAGR
jgi:hypothetical protein